MLSASRACSDAPGRPYLAGVVGADGGGQVKSSARPDTSGSEAPWISSAWGDCGSFGAASSGAGAGDPAPAGGALSPASETVVAGTGSVREITGPTTRRFPSAPTSTRPAWLSEDTRSTEPLPKPVCR